MKKTLIALLAIACLVTVGSAKEAALAGSITGDDDNVTEVCIGFIPSYTQVVNLTDNLVDEKYTDMDTNATILTTGSTGVITYPETSTIVIGTITDEDGDACYGFSYVNSGSDKLQYNVIR